MQNLFVSLNEVKKISCLAILVLGNVLVDRGQYRLDLREENRPRARVALPRSSQQSGSFGQEVSGLNSVQVVPPLALEPCHL